MEFDLDKTNEISNTDRTKNPGMNPRASTE
jgi:hypothetical protein